MRRNSLINSLFLLFFFNQNKAERWLSHILTAKTIFILQTSPDEPQKCVSMLNNKKSRQRQKKKSMKARKKILLRQVSSRLRPQTFNLFSHDNKKKALSHKRAMNARWMESECVYLGGNIKKHNIGKHYRNGHKYYELWTKKKAWNR